MPFVLPGEFSGKKSCKQERAVVLYTCMTITEREEVFVLNQPFFRRGMALLLAMLLLTGCTAQPEPQPEPAPDPVIVVPETPADTQAPTIQGAKDLVTEVGVSVSYRSGVSVSDDVDNRVVLQIDSSAVDLSTAGCYPVVYSAVDLSGNVASVSVTLTVKQPLPAEEMAAEPSDDQPDPSADAKITVTQEMLDGVTSAILSKITTAGMSKYEQARAIYNYVNQHIIYVSTSDKSDWVRGAYLGLTRGKGDCYNYWAASKALLTAAGIDNLDLTRVGGATQHFWNLVNVGNGWYHFDTCWHPSGYPLDSFMLTEAEVRAYTKKLADEIGRVNYFTYDYAACPVYVEGTPTDEPVTEPGAPTPAPSPEPDAPTEPAEPTEPEQPTEPTEPIEPEQPTEPTDPTEPEQPTEPTEPAEPAEPEQPTEPAEPTEPEQPTDPTEPEPTPGDGGETEDGNAA